MQEHSVETLDGTSLPQEQKYVPNQLMARNSAGESISITALIKTQGSDTKLVGQMQPCYEAMGLERTTLAGHPIPPVVSQIADGENGGVMMNEFPPAYRQANERIQGENHGTVAINGTEYLELLEAAGITSEVFPAIQAVHQHRLWQAVGDDITQNNVESAIQRLESAGDGFSMEGASWTSNLSWVSGYENVLEPMNDLSARFHQQFDAAVKNEPSLTGTRRYRDALLQLLLLETSCFRYWGQGIWTDYARTLFHRGEILLQQMPHDSPETPNSSDENLLLNPR